MVVVLLVMFDYLPDSVVVSQGVAISFGNIWIPVIFIPLAILTAENIRAQMKKLRTTSDQIQRTRIMYILIGVGIMAIFSLTNAIAILRRFPVDHFGNLAAAGLWTYATVKYRIVDVRFIARRGLSWAGLILAGIISYLALYIVLDVVLHLEPDPAVLTLATLGAIIIGVAIYQLRDYFVAVVDRLFYRQSYDYRQQLLDFVRHRISGIFSLKDLSTGLLPLLVGSLECKHAYLLLPDVPSTDFAVEFSEPRTEDDIQLRIRQDSPIVGWLNRENRYLASERIDILPEFRGLRWEERDQMKNLDIELLFPLISRGNLIGMLALSKKSSGHFALEDINLVENVTQQVAVNLEKEYLQEQLRRREQELSLINRLVTVMTSSLNIREVYDAFVEQLRGVVDVDWAMIGTIEGDELYFDAVYAIVDLPWRTGGTIPLKGTATEWLAVNKRSLVESELLQGKERFWTEEEFVKAGLRSIVYLPLQVKGEAIGSLVIASRQTNAYTAEHVSLLERLASQIAVSVDNSRLYIKAEQRARVDEMTGLFNRRHFDESLRKEIDRHSRHSGMLSLVLLDLDFFKDYNDKEGHPAGDRILAQISVVIQKAIRSVDIAFRYGGDEFAILLPHSDSSSAFLVAERVRTRLVRNMEEEKTGITASIGLACWPSDGVMPDDVVTAADRALYYAKRTGGNRTSIVSKMLPQSSENTLPGTKAEKEALSVIYALASTIEARDQYTYGHSRDVRRYAVLLSEALGFPSEKVAVVSIAALLHDIGKIGIPDEVLNKPSQLDSEEWELIRSHPRLSATIVGHVPSLTPCLTAILHHHERWDGLGYPSGLQGEAIPLEARILSVTDAFEAMTSPRPYRNRMSTNEAVQELQRSAGSEFDPHVVDVFIPIASTVTEIAPERNAI